MSRIIAPFVGLLVAAATLNAAILIPLFPLLREDIAQVLGEVADMRAVQSARDDRLARASRRRFPNMASGWRSWRPDRARCAATWRRQTSA